MASLVDPDHLRAHLTAQGQQGRPQALADEAAETASVCVAAYCSRLGLGDEVPPVVSRVALALAVRLASNPMGIRSVSAEGQSTDLPIVALTYFEQVLLNPYRRRTA